MSYTICDNPDCTNEGKAANHPRSPTPKICGKCGLPVRHLYADTKRGIREADEYEPT